MAIDDILQVYDFSHHPGVQGGEITVETAAEEMLHNFEQGHDRDGNVTWAEFLDYYKGMSMAIEDDEYFELMIRNAWHMSGGTGQAQGSANRRVLVIHKNGRQEVVEIQNDLGITSKDKKKMMELLQKQGVKDIADIKIG